MGKTITERRFDHSGGVQGATSWLLREQNEIEDIVNGRFDDEIGVITRRNGYEAVGDTLVTNKAGLGLFEAKFSTGAKIFGATNNSGDTATQVRTRNTDGSWTVLSMPTALAVATEINMCNSLDEVYIAGKSAAGARMTIVNVKNDLSLSETRNLISAPKARFICEYGGRLHAMNVELGGVVYPDRTYYSSPALSVITFTRGEQITNSTNKVNVDSVRYLKAAMAIDIYDHILGTARYSNVTISSVDKAADTITLPARSGALTFTAATTDLLTVSSTTNYPTGTPVYVTTAGTIPAGLIADTTYYAINISGTTLKLATTAANATAGTAIDITSTGSGTHTINLPYVIPDNEEVSATGRHGELGYYWNTDYPTADKAEYIKLPSGAAANSEIVGYSKSNNRLLLMTDTTTHKWDLSQLITIYEDIGCANHRTIVNIGDNWTIWLDGDKRVVAHNEATGQQEFISRAIKKKYLKDVPAANLLTASAGKIENIYKLCLGTVGDKVLRVSYDFDSNNWSRDEHIHEMRQHITSKFSGDKKLYFLGENGKLYRDDTGNTDDGVPIPMKIKYGRNHSGTSQIKDYQGWYIFGQNMSGGQVRCYIDGKPDPIELGKLTGNISIIEVGQKAVSGRYINLEISHVSHGDPVAIEGYEQYLATMEDKFGGK